MDEKEDFIIMTAIAGMILKSDPMRESRARICAKKLREIDPNAVITVMQKNGNYILVANHEI